MISKDSKKHFLDTSIARPILLGTTKYKQYLNSKIDPEKRYISHYVQMEIKRSYLINIIGFYFVLRLPTISTIGDAVALWSNEFQSSRLKAILQLISQLFSTQCLDFDLAKDKEKSLHILGIYIKRFESSLRRNFKDTGCDSTHCTRAKIPFKINLDNMAEGFKEFVDEFNDKKSCRSKCHIDKFLLVRHRNNIEMYVQKSTQFAQKTGAHQGFVKISQNLKEILEKGESACSCNRCEKIGDAVIALDSPRDMQLEHIDNSFDYLCPPIAQPHLLHPSEKKVLQTSIQIE
jgi:hypothetical protein